MTPSASAPSTDRCRRWVSPSSIVSVTFAVMSWATNSRPMTVSSSVSGTIRTQCASPPASARNSNVWTAPPSAAT